MNGVSGMILIFFNDYTQNSVTWHVMLVKLYGAIREGSLHIAMGLEMNIYKV